MLRPEHDQPHYYGTEPCFNHVYRGAYSAFDPSRPTPPYNAYARMTDGYLNPNGTEVAHRISHEPFGKRSSLTTHGELVG